MANATQAVPAVSTRYAHAANAFAKHAVVLKQRLPVVLRQRLPVVRKQRLPVVSSSKHVVPTSSRAARKHQLLPAANVTKLVQAVSAMMSTVQIASARIVLVRSAKPKLRLSSSRVGQELN